MNSLLGHMDQVMVNGVKCLFSDLRRHDIPDFTTNDEYPFVFDVRSDDNLHNPRTIEKKVLVNHFGTLLSPVDFLSDGADYAEIGFDPGCDCEDSTNGNICENCEERARDFYWI